jgi:hypothetical protein
MSGRCRWVGCRSRKPHVRPNAPPAGWALWGIVRPGGTSGRPGGRGRCVRHDPAGHARAHRADRGEDQHQIHRQARRRQRGGRGGRRRAGSEHVVEEHDRPVARRDVGERPRADPQVGSEVRGPGGGVESHGVPRAAREGEGGHDVTVPVAGEPAGDAQHVVPTAGPRGRRTRGRGHEQAPAVGEPGERCAERVGQRDGEVASAPFLVGDDRVPGGPRVGRERHRRRQVGPLRGGQRAAQGARARRAQRGARRHRRPAPAARGGQHQVDQGLHESRQHALEARAPGVGPARGASWLGTTGERCPQGGALRAPIPDTPAPTSSTRPGPSATRPPRSRAGTTARPGRRPASGGRAPPPPR